MSDPRVPHSSGHVATRASRKVQDGPLQPNYLVSQPGKPRRLVVCESSDEAPGDTERADEVFVVEEALRETSKAEYDRVYRCISNADVDLELDLPVYEVAWKHMLNYRRGRLHEMVLLYRRLEEAVEATGPDRLVCRDDLESAYAAVINDVADEYDLAVSCPVRSARTVLLQRFVVSSVLLLPFLLDQVLGLVLQRLTSQPADRETVFVPALGRLDSTIPVLREMRGEFGVVVASMASSWLWTFGDDELTPFGPTAVSRFTSLRCLARQLSTHLRLARRALFSDMLKGQLEGVLADELDVHVDRALVYAIQQGFRTRMFGSLYLYYLFDNLIDELQCENIVIGGLSPAGKAIVAKGIDAGCETYHIPHGIGAAANCPNPPTELTQFVSGDLEKRHYAESPQVAEPWTCIATGRPYLTELYDEYRADRVDQSSTEPYHVVLATQPINQRDEFVGRTIAAIGDAEFDASVTIKIHPSESPDRYAGFAQREGVTVADANLHDLLQGADLTLTVNSNVGVESVVVGTPCVSLNWWSPIVPIPMYAQYGGIPAVTDAADLDDFFAGVDGDRLATMLADQSETVHEYYELEVNAERRIAATIEPSDIER